MIRRARRGQTRNSEIVPGWGGLLTGIVHISNRNDLFFSGVAGEGIASFISAFAGKGLDVVSNPTTGELSALGSLGAYVSVSHAWRPHLTSYLTGGFLNLRYSSQAPPDAFDWSDYISGNLFWDATAGTRLGVEFSFGRRTNVDRQWGDAARLSFIMYFDF
jgi:hypothetical protein